MDNDLLDMIAAGQDGSATDIHDKIKDLLYAKAAENVDIVKPAVTADMFGGPNPHLNTEEEPEEEEEAPGTPSSVEDTTEVEVPTAEVETPDDEVEEEKPEA